MPRRKNIVTIGGGTGTSVVLSGLRKYPVNLFAIVTVMDSGGSTGRLVREFDVHPMGDIRQALLALSYADKSHKDFFNLRFHSAGLKGHNAGNLFIAGYEKQLGSFDRAIKKAEEYLSVHGSVIPVTLDRVDLVAELINGRKIVGEHAFDDLTKKQNIFKKLSLTKKANANPKAVAAIKKADVIVICPGNPLRSVLPNFLLDGIKQALAKSSAPVVLCANLMNKKGQTGSMNLTQMVDFYEKYIGKKTIDYVIYNTQQISENILKKYKLKDEKEIKKDNSESDKVHYSLIGAPLIADRAYKQEKTDVLLQRTKIRHDPQKLATIIMKIVQNSIR